MKYLFSIIFLGITPFLQAQIESDTVKSEAYYEKLVEDRLDALDLHNIGYQHYRDQNYDSAISYYNRAIALDSGNAHYYANRGNASFALNQWKKALADYVHSDAMDPGWTHENSFFSAEILRKYLGRPDEALPLYDRAAVIMRNNQMPVEIYLCYFNKGNIHIKAKRYSEAVQEYNQALGFRDKHLGSLVNRGIAFIALNKKEAACADWAKAASLGSEAPGGYLGNYCK